MLLDVGNIVYHFVDYRITGRSGIVEVDEKIAIDDMRRRIFRRRRLDGMFAPESVYTPGPIKEYYLAETPFIAQKWYRDQGRKVMDKICQSTIADDEERLMMAMLGGSDTKGFPLYSQNVVLVFPGSKLETLIRRMTKKLFLDAPIWASSIGAFSYRLSETAKIKLSAKKQKEIKRNDAKTKWTSHRYGKPIMVVPSVRTND